MKTALLIIIFCTILFQNCRVKDESLNGVWILQVKDFTNFFYFDDSIAKTHNILGYHEYKLATNTQKNPIEFDLIEIYNDSLISKGIAEISGNELKINYNAFTSYFGNRPTTFNGISNGIFYKSDWTEQDISKYINQLFKEKKQLINNKLNDFKKTKNNATLLEVARLHQEIKEFSSSEEINLKLCRDSKYKKNAWENLVDLYSDLGEDELAIKYLDSIFQNIPQKSFNYIFMAKYYFKYGFKDIGCELLLEKYKPENAYSSDIVNELSNTYCE